MVTMNLPPWLRTSVEPEVVSAESRPDGEAWTRTMLLVEDDTFLAATAEMLLETLGYRIRYASTAAQALDLLQKGDIDVVFADIVLPGGISGIDFAKTLRDRAPGLPVVLTTGSQSAAAEARAQGFIVLEKPCRAEVLESTLRSALGQSGSTSSEIDESDALVNLLRVDRRRPAA
jgi:DNA-binding NtrC family response regulator